MLRFLQAGCHTKFQIGSNQGCLMLTSVCYCRLYGVACKANDSFSGTAYRQPAETATVCFDWVCSFSTSSKSPQVIFSHDRNHGSCSGMLSGRCTQYKAAKSRQPQLQQQQSFRPNTNSFLSFYCHERINSPQNVGLTVVEQGHCSCGDWQ